MKITITSNDLLKETVPHGNDRFPYSFHETFISAESESILYPHWHKECEFLYLLEGNGIFQVGKHTYSMKAGECLFIPPNELHKASNPSKETCHFFAFVFRPLALYDYNDNPFYFSYIEPLLSGAMEFPYIYTLDIPWQAEFLSLIQKLYLLLDKPLEQTELLVKSHLFGLWHIMYEHPLRQSKVKSKERTKIQPALTYIQEHFEEAVPLECLAKSAHMSISQLTRLFKKETGLSPFSYLIRYRIYKSCYYLTHSDEKIAAIALMSGFSSINNYNKSFQKIIGCSPSIYRNNSDCY
jgi:AraC-like DNA-binding protein